ncbi:hypothetical protein [Streptomyces sp. NRRL B-1347]|uniref:hypothetical protein n=1 Tax=Streptomyces sp. NRRL B-1347 TaxID=1476877 RepID=UPI0004C7A865|nr:hypothetical protein [Streptomyces sp. NRRL B-1347]
MAESAKDFCSDLVDLSGVSLVSLAELHAGDDPVLRRALNRAARRASVFAGTLDEQNSEEMALLRGDRPRQRK